MADKKSLVNIDFGGASSIKNLPSASPTSSDCIVLTDESDGGKAKKGPSFGTNDGTFLRKDGTWAGLGGTTISANATPIVTFKKSATSSGSFIGFKPNNQDNSVWLTGVTSALAYRFSYSTNGSTTVTKKMELDTNGNLEVVGSISEAGTALSSKYLGISSTAADSSKLNGQAASYYLNYDNLTNKPTIPAAQVNSDWNASSGVAAILNKPTIPTKDSDLTNDRYVRYDTNAQGLTSTQKSNARTNIGAGTGNGTVTSVDSVSPTSGNVSLSAVRYTAQTLTDAQKTQARTNIGAVALGNTASTAAAGNHDHDGQYLSTQGGELMSGNVPILTLYNKNDLGPTYIDFKYSGQDARQWRIGAERDDCFYIQYAPNGSSSFVKKVWATPTGELWTDADIYEAGTKLASKYLGISATAADSSKLNGQNASYYLNYSNLSNKPSAVLYSSQSLTDAQKTQARNNIGASVKKYRHNIRLYWSGGSESGYATGTLYFSFKDDTSSSYGASGYTHTLSTLQTFLATHCGMTGNGSKHLGVNGCAIMGNTTAANLNYNTYTVCEINYDSGSWYCDGTYLWQKKSTTPSGGKGIGYLDALFPTNASGNYIQLEDEVEED